MAGLKNRVLLASSIVIALSATGGALSVYASKKPVGSKAGKVQAHLPSSGEQNVTINSTADTDFSIDKVMGSFADDDDEPAQKAQEEWRLPIFVSLSANGDGVRVRPVQAVDQDFREDNLLATFNGRPLNGMTAIEIQNLFLGKEGESATLGVINREAEYRTFTFAYKKQKKPESQNFSIARLVSTLSRWGATTSPCRPMPYQSYESDDVTDIDLFNRANARNAITYARDTPQTSDAVVTHAALGAIGPLLTEGSLSDAQKYINVVLQTPVSDGPQQKFDKELGHALTMMHLCGLGDPAAKIGKSIFAADSAGKYWGSNDPGRARDDGRLEFYKAYLKIVAGKDLDEAAKLTKKIKQADSRNQQLNPDTLIWFGDFYAAQGQFEEAIENYQKVLTDREQHPVNKQISEARYSCYLLTRMADFADGLKDHARSLGFLAKAKQLWQDNFDQKSLEHISQIALLVPTPKMVEERLNGSVATQTTIFSQQTLRKEPTSEEIEYMGLFNSARAAIGRSDRNQAQADISQLLTLYKQRHLIRHYPRPCVNMFTCLLQLARSLADKGDYDQSNRLLMLLQNITTKAEDHSPAAAVFTAVEIGLNNQRAKRPTDQFWTRLWAQLKLTDSSYERFRDFGCLYAAAGEYERAKVLFDLAGQDCRKHLTAERSNAKTSLSPSSHLKVEYTLALLQLDKASLACDNADWASTRELFGQALTTFDNIEISSPSRELEDLNRTFLEGSLAIAVAVRKGQSASDAEKILEQIKERINNKNSWLGVFLDAERAGRDEASTDFYYYLGRLLFDQKKYPQARQYLDQAIARQPNNVNRDLRFVRAQCAEVLKDYAVAARDYKELAENFSAGPSNTLAGGSLHYLRKALELGQKAKPLDSKMLAKICTQLADSIPDSTSASLPEKLELYKKAQDLTPVGDREKVELGQKILNLSQVQLNAASAGASGTAAERLKLLESTATMTESLDSGRANLLWMNLASEEIKQNQIDKAIKHIEHAIASTKGHAQNYENTGFDPLTIQDHGIASLAQAGKSTEAERLYKMRLASIKTLFGDKSPEYSQVLSELLFFYYQINNQTKALEYLNQFLAVDPRKQELGKHGGFDNLGVSGIRYQATVKKQNPALAKTLVTRFLEAQKERFGDDDRHVSYALTDLAALSSSEGDDAVAEKLLREALRIDNLYANEMYMGASSARGDLLSLLAKNKRDEARIELENQSKLERKEIQKHWSMLEKGTPAQTREFYDWWHKFAPFNQRTLSAGLKLLDQAAKTKDWAAVKEIAPDCINILAHNSLTAVVGCTLPPQPDQQKFDVFTKLIQACINTGDVKQADKWLKRAVAEKSYNPNVNELLFLSEIERLCGNRNEALIYCRGAEEVRPKISGYDWYRGRVSEQFSKLNSAEDMDRLKQEFQTERLRQQEKDLLAFEARHKAKIAAEAETKQPPKPAVSSANATKRPDRELQKKEWTPEPNEAMVFPPVLEVKDRYLFNYAAMASQTLWLTGNSYVIRPDNRINFPGAPLYSCAGSYNAMACHQPTHKAGDFLFLFDGPDKTLLPKIDLPTQSVPGGHGMHGGTSTGGMAISPFYRPLNGPPPVMARPFKAALVAPKNASPIPAPSGQNKLAMPAGDYAVDSLTTDGIAITTRGRLRLFLTGVDKGKEPSKITLPPKISDNVKAVFEAKKNAFINLHLPNEPPNAAQAFEIWYDGRGVIRLDDSVHFYGLIYAPNATIFLGKDVHFRGAMVAQTIASGTGCEIMYEPQLSGWRQ